ncbi:MAG TPA: ester cyclase [Candidatus Bathyarchaeia archaeon]|jgi:predicted ester cyclase|nr:ester cyclase [Candidatus Bathyarchaeia archaeon]
MASVSELDVQGSEEANKALVRRFIDEFKNGCRLDSVDELCSPGFVMHGAETRGPNDLKEFRSMIAKAHPNARGHVDDLLADGDRVVERSTWRAPRTGETDSKPVRWWEIHIYRIENGKIAELWSQADTPRPDD